MRKSIVVKEAAKAAGQYSHAVIANAVHLRVGPGTGRSRGEHRAR